MPKMCADHVAPALSAKILTDLLKAVTLHEDLESFEIIPTPETDHKNVSPVVIQGSTLGFHSWAIPHVLPYAHSQVINQTVDRSVLTLSACLLAVNLLHPEMNTSWNRRRELVLSKNLSSSTELRISRMALTAHPKCNEVLSYRRWLYTHEFPSDRFDDVMLLENELEMLDDIADRYQANYHAWSHRKWCLSLKAAVPKTCTGFRRMTEFTKEYLSNLYLRTNLSVYCKELERNSDFLDTHVSDHCGMHFRSFLLDQLFLILRNSYIDLSVQPVIVDHGFYRFVVTEIDAQVKVVNEHLKSPILTEYVANFRDKLSLFAIEAAFLLNSLSKNKELIHYYPSHEALWCFRKCLFSKFHACVQESECVVWSLVYDGIIHSEKRLLKLNSILTARDPNFARVVRNYCDYVKRVLKIDLDY